MKHIPLLICLLFNTTLQSSAQKRQDAIRKVVRLHTIIFADTYDTKIGKSCKQDLENIENEFKYIAVAANLIYGDNTKHVLTPNNFSISSFDSILSNSWKGENFNRFDVLIVYFTGHGYRTRNNKTSFPYLKISSNPADNLNAYELHKHIRNRVRYNLQLTIIDACNKNPDSTITKSYHTKMSKWTSDAFSVRKPIDKGSIPIIVNSVDRINYTELFRNVSGEIIITSSEPGYFSYTDKDGGSCFTNSFIKSLHRDVRLLRNDNNWKSVFEYTKTETTNRVRINKPKIDWAKHKPIWNDTLIFIDSIYSDYGISIAGGKELAENERCQLKISFQKSIQSNQGRVRCYINPTGEWGRSSSAMLSEIDSVEYFIYSKNADGSFNLKKEKSKERDKNFSIITNGKSKDKIFARVRFNTGIFYDLNIMHLEE